MDQALGNLVYSWRIHGLQDSADVTNIILQHNYHGEYVFSPQPVHKDL